MGQIKKITKDALFNKDYLGDLLDSKRNRLKDLIGSWQVDFISKNDENELIEDLIEKFRINPIILNEEAKAHSGLIDIKVDVSNEPGRDIRRGKTIHVRGKSITVSVPYIGDSILFNFQTNFLPTGFSKAEVGQSEISITYEVYSYDDSSKETGDLINNTFDQDLHTIKKDLIHINNEVISYNNSLEKFIKEIIGRRKTELSIDIDLEKSIKFPLKQRKNISEPVSLPLKRKSIRIEQKVSTEISKGDIEQLTLKDYNEIITTMKLMALVMEQSPRAIKNMQEEDLRWLFLVVLNGIYEGLATGETFNYYGKTDIIIKWKGINLFICECKFWKGKEVFLETIDQLQNYITWRDTKTAIVIFNTNKAFTDVLEKIEKYTKDHNCFDKFLGNEGQTIFHYEFHHKEDKDRKFLLTIMAFDVPK